MIKAIKNFYNKIKMDKYVEPLDSEDNPLTHINVFHKQYPRLPKIKLPEINRENSDFEKLLEKRNSYRNFTNQPLSLEQVSKVLGSCRITDDLLEPERRSYPSAGARFPVELYLISYNIKDLDKGVYHYDIQENELELLLKKNLRSLDKHFISPFLDNPAGTILFTSVIPRSEIKYGARAYPYSLLEAGHMAQNIHLSAFEAGIGSCPVSGFVDKTVRETLDLTENEIPIYSISIGNKREGLE